MKKFSIGAMARIIGASPVPDVHDGLRVTSDKTLFGVSTDSRTVGPGDCFFAITGEKFDGHDFIAEVFAKGAACAVVSRDVSDPRPAGKSILKVDDTTKALGDFARHYRRLCGFKVVAITGSVGKTTTRQIIYHVLSSRYRVTQSPRSFNNNIGLPATLLAAEPDDDIVVAEIGANRPGEVAYLTRIAQPDIALVTNVHPAHLEGFGDLQTIVREKLSIAEGLKAKGLLIINADIEQLVSTCTKLGIAFRGFGRSPHADYRAEHIEYIGLDSRFTIGGTMVRLPLPGPGNVENAIAAWAVCSQFGISSNEFAEAVRTLKSVSMRAELLQAGSLTILNDCYNANPASMRNALQILAGLGAHLEPRGQRRLVFICGEMAELGRQSERLHAELGSEIASAGVGLLLAVGKLAQVAAQAARRAGVETVCFDDTVSLCDSLARLIRQHDIMLVKGSRTAKLETAVERLKELFGPAPVAYPMEEDEQLGKARRAAVVEGRTDSSHTNRRVRDRQGR